MKCPHCGFFGLSLIANDSATKQCYDYREHIDIYYYQCSDCKQYCDERLSNTGLRRLTPGMAKKTQKLVDLKHN